ncbi:MAG: 5'-methylthioadenosine/S-adenosylhomocysteine nucleosidase [Pseudomonadota bacterium]
MISSEDLPLVKTIAGRTVLYVMATKVEYKAALQAAIQPLIIQVGPVEATARLSHWLTAHGPVDFVVSLGSAGSKRLEQTSVNQASHVSYRDMDASPFGFEKGITPFIDHEPAIACPVIIPGLPAATLGTGASVVAGEGFDAVAEDMVDMESFAVLRVCQLFATQTHPCHFIGLRGISDGAEPAEGYADWTRYLDIVDQNLAAAVARFEQALEEGKLVIQAAS